MNTVITKPERDAAQSVERINVNLISKNWQAVVIDENVPVGVNFNIQSIIDQMNATQKTIVKGFLKACVVEAINAHNAAIGVVIEDTAVDTTEDIFA